MNLSYPFGGDSVNGAISKDRYLGKDVDLRYPSLDDLVRIISKKG